MGVLGEGKGVVPYLVFGCFRPLSRIGFPARPVRS